MSDILTDLRAAHALYAEAGVDGAEGARMMQAAADEIERLRARVAELETQARNLDIELILINDRIVK